MYSSTIALLGLAGSALAAPAPQVGVSGIPSVGQPFGIVANGPNINNVNIRARNNHLFVGGTQNPTCEGGARQDYATFVLYSDQTLFLYTHSNPVQQVWVDASGMGQGQTQYTKPEAKVKNASTDPFHIDDKGTLSFDHSPTKACPLSDGSYEIWFSSLDKPGTSEGCVEVTLTTYYAPARVACQYEEVSK